MTIPEICLPCNVAAEMAVLSADIEDSVSQYTREQQLELNRVLLNFVNRNLTDIVPTVVAKVNGDGLLVVTGTVEKLPTLASRLVGAFVAEMHNRAQQAVAKGLQVPSVRLRLGASFGRLILVSGVGGRADAMGDPINRAVRIQSENSKAQSLWCDQSVISALVRAASPIAISIIGETEVRNFGKQLICSIAEEALDPSVVRKLTCFHQGQTIQQWVLASWMHRSLKETLRQAEAGDTEKLAELGASKKALLDFLRTSLQIAALGTFDLLQKHFVPRLPVYGGTPPRICLKGFDDLDGNQAQLIDLVREEGVKHGAAVWPSQNSGFQHVVSTGVPFLCNDLATELDTYINPRLNREEVRKLKSQIDDKPTYQITESDWRHCWNDSWEYPRSCYRSTLIIPLTLKNNPGLTAQFVDRFLGGNSKERFIYGALCFDHVSPQFFRHEDIDIAYVAADWLSLYLLTQRNYSNGSSTFIKCSSLIQSAAI